ncbi:MAG: hypothetical protein GF331_05530 [Chitinivibrionales bacterium]|nr:hypothetical protein [Chitinivibrionales bacterium]
MQAGQTHSLVARIGYRRTKKTECPGPGGPGAGRSLSVSMRFHHRERLPHQSPATRFRGFSVEHEHVTLSSPKGDCLSFEYVNYVAIRSKQIHASAGRSRVPYLPSIGITRTPDPAAVCRTYLQGSSAEGGNVMRSEFISLILLVLLWVPALGLDATGLFWYKRNSGGSGIWLSDLSSGNTTRIWNDGVANGARFSPCGRFIAFGYNGALYVMKNDGSEVRELTGGFNPDRGEFAYTYNGIFWAAKPDVYRYDFDADARTRLRQFTNCKDTPGKGYFGSLDGRRAWIYFDIIPENNPDRNGHGDMAFVEYSADFSTMETVPKPGVGYGHMLTMDGAYVIIGSGGEPVYRLLDFTETYIDSTVDPPQLRPVENTYPSEHPQDKGVTSKSGFTPCPNDNRYVLMRDENLKYWILDWTPENTDAPTELRCPSAGEPYSGGVWMGALPDPDGPPTDIMHGLRSTHRKQALAGRVDDGRIVFRFEPQPEAALLAVYDLRGRAAAVLTVRPHDGHVTWRRSGRVCAAPYIARLSDGETTHTISIVDMGN